MITSEEMVKIANDLFKFVDTVSLKAVAIPYKRLKEEYDADVGIEIVTIGYSLVSIVNGEIELVDINKIRKVPGYIAMYGTCTGGTYMQPPDYDIIEFSKSNSFEHVLGESLMFIVKDRIEVYFENLMEERRYQEEKEMGF